jgi:hypothetical protein
MTQGKDETGRRKIGSETPTDARLFCRAERARPRLHKREAHICRRSTAALARRTLVPKAQRQARLPGTQQERLVRNARSNRGAKTLRSYNGRYPLSPVPVQRGTSHPGPSAGGMMPDAARERVAKPPAGTAPAPWSGLPAGPCPIHGRDDSRLCNRNGDECQHHVTVSMTLPVVMAGLDPAIHDFCFAGAHDDKRPITHPPSARR